jgi:arsenite methyltransferase
MAYEMMVDAATLREQVKEKYRELAVNPHSGFHFHTGRTLASRLGYDEILTASLPGSAVESFAGVANPFSLRSLSGGERVVDLGSGEDSTVSWRPGRLVPRGMSSEWI